MRWVVAAAFAVSCLSLADPAVAQHAGQLISADPVGEPPDGMQAWRIPYWTTTAKSAPIRVTGMVIAPREAIPLQPRPVIAWTHGTLPASLRRTIVGGSNGKGGRYDRLV